MNEQIKQLAEQARQYYLTLPTGYDPEKVGMYPQLMEKFAELIVRECVEVANNHFESKEPGYPGDKIEQHFGVEE